jgi:hypothetical protein
VNTATSAASEGVRQDIPELVRNAARGFAEGSGPLMDKVPMMVGDSMRQGVEGFVQGWKPGLQDLRAGIGPAAQSAWEGAKGLAANRKVQGGAAAALALYGGKKVYDAYQEHKLRRLAGDFMEHEHPGFAGAHDLGSLMAANRIGQFSGKTASFGSAAALGVVGVPIGAIGGVVDPVGVWRDSVFRMRHPRKKLTPAELRAGRAGLGLGAAATQAALLYGAYRGGKALYNHFRPEEEGGEEAPVKEAGAWDTVKQFAKGHTMSNSPLAAGLHAGVAKGTIGGVFTGGYTALKGRQEGEGWGDLARRSAVSGAKGAVGGAITTGVGVGAMQHFVNKAHMPGATGDWAAKMRYLHPQAASGPQTFAHMQQAAAPKEYTQRMVDISKGNYPGAPASAESPYSFPL